MAKSESQKLKLIYLYKIFLEKTDENHGITMAEIIRELGACGIKAERKSIYKDIAELNDNIIEIEKEQIGGNCYYHVVEHRFELAELKLLVDAVQCSRFITAKKTNQLIKKLENLASVHEAKELQRQVYVSGRIKTMNESIFYNIDRIHSAISMGKQISFQYFNWSVRKEEELKKDGARYEVSPWALTWDDENYYLVAFDAQADIIKHYRVDKMKRIEQVEKERKGKECFEQIDLGSYFGKMFGMYGGKDENVKLQMTNDKAGIVIDRFGKNVNLIPVDNHHFTVNVSVAVSQQFIGWILGLGEGVKVLEPESLKKRIYEEGQRIVQLYQ